MPYAKKETVQLAYMKDLSKKRKSDSSDAISVNMHISYKAPLSELRSRIMNDLSEPQPWH